MNETLTELAVEYGWGCPRCAGTGYSPHPGPRPLSVGLTCPDCHGNRVTPSDAEEFERLVAAVVRGVEASLPPSDEGGIMPMPPDAPVEALERRRRYLACDDLRRDLDSLQRAKAVNP